MSPAEIRAGASLAGVFGLRMLGLFFILPVFAVHASTLKGGDDRFLVGLVLGMYGLTQALLQIPFGMASDRLGRKPVIAAGLLIFAAGSFLAASATDIWTAIAGRALQGAGAISSVVVALAADLTRDQHRGKVMAMIGTTIGFSFALSLVAAPALYEQVGMAGLFILVGVLSLAAIWVVFAMVPAAPPVRRSESGEGDLAAAFAPELLRLNAGIFVLHMVLMAMFVVVPPLIVEAGLPIAAHWKLYLPAVLVSFAIMIPPIFHADRRNRAKPVMICSIAALAVVQVTFGLVQPSLASLAVLLVTFFAAFNILEALIPSLVSRVAPAQSRGAAIGVFNTAQTLGLSGGGALGGWLAQHWGSAAVFTACGALVLVWLALAAGMQPPAPVNASPDFALSGKPRT